MPDFLDRIVNDRALYITLILFNTPGWAAYSAVSYGPGLLPAIEHSPFYTMAGLTILTLDALVILAYVLHTVPRACYALKARWIN